MKAPQFIFVKNGEILDSADLADYARQFGYYRGFNPTNGRDNAERFLEQLGERFPGSEVVLYTAVAASVPQPAQIEKVS